MKSVNSCAANLRLNQFVPYLITVLAARVSAELATRYEKRFGISIPEWRVIAHLTENKAVSVRDDHLAKTDVRRLDTEGASAAKRLASRD